MVKKYFILLLLLLSVNVYAEILVAPTRFDKQSDWNSFEQTIMSSKDQSDTISWQGCGGKVTIAFQFETFIADEISRGKLFNFVVSGPALSMHAFILCFFDNVTFSKGSFLMFHSLETTQTDCNGVTRSARTLDDYDMRIFKVCREVGYVTNKDIRDFTVGKKEVYIKYSIDGKRLKSIEKPDTRPNGEGY